MTGAEEREVLALRSAAELLGLDPAGAQLVSASSRIIWHLPKPSVAMVISRPGTKSMAEVQAEAAAIRAAVAVGAQAPRLLAGPVALDHARILLAYHWIVGRPIAPCDWPAVARELARLARGSADDLAVLSWPAELPARRWRELFGAELHASFAERCQRAAATIRAMTADRTGLVLCHGDVQPANVLVDADDDVPWLIDFEYACLAPPEWDPAKISILGRRFGDPHDVGQVISSWPEIDPIRLGECIAAQETLLVAWLARMALTGTKEAAAEARRRALSLSGEDLPWRHLS